LTVLIQYSVTIEKFTSQAYDSKLVKCNYFQRQNKRQFQKAISENNIAFFAKPRGMIASSFKDYPENNLKLGYEFLKITHYIKNTTLQLIHLNARTVIPYEPKILPI